jgi:hypothetical protein
LSVTEQDELLPLHAPDQPANTEPGLAVAFSVKAVPGFAVVAQAAPPAPQEIPAGVLETSPLPTPATFTVKVLEQPTSNTINGRRPKTTARLSVSRNLFVIGPSFAFIRMTGRSSY